MEGLRQLEAVADPAVRTAANEVVQRLMEMHGAALERLLDITFESGDEGKRLIDEYGRDPLISSVLVLYGLHPDDLQTRVEQKLQELRGRLFKMGAEVTAIAITGDEVRIRVDLKGHTCGSTAANVKAVIEEAVYDAAPDLGSLVVEGLGERSSAGFVALEALAGVGSGSVTLIFEAPTHPSDGMD